MNDVTEVLQAIDRGDQHAASQLLPLVYDELRRLAAHKLAHEAAGQTLAPTALVHEAYLRLAPGKSDRSNQKWDSRGHFFAAAAEAMRRILVENARRKKSLKHGGGGAREPLDDAALALPELREDLLALDEALSRLETVDPQAAQLVQLRYFGGLTLDQIADLLDISRRTTDRLWAFARAWLHREIMRIIGNIDTEESK